MTKPFSRFAALAAAASLLCSCAAPDAEPGLSEEVGAELAPETESASVAADLEACRYDDALSRALKEKTYGIANYIAEYVMETDELLAFVAAHYPNAPEDSAPAENADGEISGAANEAANAVRYALARRLMRENLPQRSREFFPRELRPVFDAYVEAIRRGYDFEADDVSRARGFWDAAVIVRGNGDALFSLFSVPEFVEAKEFATDDERDRVLSRGISEPVVSVRQRAANLARFAAGLLPNNDERTARLLFTAGVWLRARDDKAAEEFYKTLVIRCPKTEVGRRCIALRWLPSDVPWTREQAWDGVPAAEDAGAATR